MVKKIYSLVLALFVTGIFFSACVDSDDSYKIDEEWLTKNQNDFNALVKDQGYSTITGIADPTTYILRKESSFWKDSGEASASTSDVSPIFSDSVTCRYEGWFFDKEDKKIIFDSTENPTYYSSADPNKIPQSFYVGSLIDGWRVALYNMKEGDEWDIVVPYSLGYGSSINGNIPAFTTLYFSLKLIKVKKRLF